MHLLRRPSPLLASMLRRPPQPIPSAGMHRRTPGHARRLLPPSNRVRQSANTEPPVPSPSRATGEEYRRRPPRPAPAVGRRCLCAPPHPSSAGEETPEPPLTSLSVGHHASVPYASSGHNTTLVRRHHPVRLDANLPRHLTMIGRPPCPSTTMASTTPPSRTTPLPPAYTPLHRPHLPSSSSADGRVGAPAPPPAVHLVHAMKKLLRSGPTQPGTLARPGDAFPSPPARAPHVVAMMTPRVLNHHHISCCVTSLPSSNAYKKTPDLQ